MVNTSDRIVADDIVIWTPERSRVLESGLAACWETISLTAARIQVTGINDEGHTLKAAETAGSGVSSRPMEHSL